MKTLLEKYTKLNNSFKETLVFHIGYNSGFFSEYNNMIFAMLFCLENNIKFTLYSGDANFKYSTGWEDYFEPFCEQRTEDFHHQYNVREIPNLSWVALSFIKRGYFPQKWFTNRIKNYAYLLRKKYFRSTYNFDYLTFDIWDSFRKNKNFAHKNFHIPELGINGDLQTACHVLVQLTWRYNAQTKTNVENLVKQLQLPNDYIGFHIRSGDKIKETNLYESQIYIEKAQKYSNTKNAFVLTDDYQIIELFDKQYKIYTLCEKNERGYIHSDFEKNTPDQLRKSHEKLFASIEALSQSEIFIGTFSSNPGTFLGMKMDKNKTFAVDYDKWELR